MSKNYITFSKNAKKQILDSFDKTLDSENMIVEKSDLKQRVLSAEGQELSLNEFGGIKKGSEVFLSNNLVSLIRHRNKY